MLETTALAPDPALLLEQVETLRRENAALRAENAALRLERAAQAGALAAFTGRPAEPELLAAYWEAYVEARATREQAEAEAGL
jgi:hypothetical protein